MSKARFSSTIAVTGGAGFIGSNLLTFLVGHHHDRLFVNLDTLTYAGNLANLKSIEDSPNYRFVKLDIADSIAVEAAFDQFQFDGVIHLAAETHVDRSILGPHPFIRTNVVGTLTLLEAVRRSGRRIRFHHVSTDEVFGSLGPTGLFREDSPYRPSSPYAASKASADHLVRAYHQTYGLDCVITNCSNNFGPYQFPEKLIPLTIRNAVAGETIPVYGDGLQVRDWLYVADHCRALDLVYREGITGGTYLIGADNELTNRELIQGVCRELDRRLGGGPREKLMRTVADRPGHDRRYAMDSAKIRQELGWAPSVSFDDAIATTVDWYLTHADWLDACVTGEYRKYYELNYANRQQAL